MKKKKADTNGEGASQTKPIIVTPVSTVVRAVARITPIRAMIGPPTNAASMKPNGPTKNIGAIHASLPG